MAIDDDDFMDEMLKNAERHVMVSLRDFQQAQQWFDAKFKKAFLQALNSRVASTYSKFEVELQLNRSEIGTAKCEPRNDVINYFTSVQVGKNMNLLDGFVAPRSKNIETAHEILDSSDDEDAEPVIRTLVRTRMAKPVNETDHQENKRKGTTTKSTQRHASDGESSSTNRLAPSKDFVVPNSLDGNSVQTEQETAQQSVLARSQVSPQKNKPATNQFRTVNAGTSSGKTINRAVGSKLKHHKCVICDYVTLRKSDIKRHMRIHTGERPFECHRCLKRFAQSWNLNKHLVVHVKRYKFHCVSCLRGFHRAKGKIEHDKVCQNRRYECYLCKALTTVDQRQMKLHMRKHFVA